MNEQLIELDMAEQSPAVQAAYQALRKKGNSPSMAQMLAMRQAPGLQGTDSQLWQGMLTDFASAQAGGDRVAPVDRAIASEVMRQAQAAGISTSGRMYIDQLADERGPATPEAWVADMHDLRTRADRLRDERKRRWEESEAALERPGLAQEAVEEEVLARCQRDPSLAAKVKVSDKALRELEEQVVHDHAPRQGPIEPTSEDIQGLRQQFQGEDLSLLPAMTEALEKKP